MKQKKFLLTKKDEEMLDLISKTDQKTLALWAIDCTERVLPYFGKAYTEDHRPRQTLKTLQDWIKTGVFKMAVIRKASLEAHAAARDADEDSPARSAARGSGQTVATAHVPSHAYGPCNLWTTSHLQSHEFRYRCGGRTKLAVPAFTGIEKRKIREVMMMQQSDEPERSESNRLALLGYVGTFYQNDLHQANYLSAV